jgi:predicted unusual protein kinase regulating ubiquinone biosynthesis (AarF/ABC1/UbiB family)
MYHRLQLLSDMASFAFPDFSFGWLVTEFRGNLTAEFDFRTEAKNSQLTHERFRYRRAAVKCPKVRWDLTSRR